MNNQDFILFYNGPFSQWFPSPFTAKTLFPPNTLSDFKWSQTELNFANCEQYMMFEKAMLFEDYQSAETIIKHSSPKIIKSLGRKVRDFDEKIWQQHREQIVFTGNYHKFTQNEELKKLLKNSGKKTFVEASPTDKIWGIGLAKNDKNAYDPSKWQGLNLLGKSITLVRDKLFV